MVRVTQTDSQFGLPRAPGTWACLEDALPFGIKASGLEDEREYSQESLVSTYFYWAMNLRIKGGYFS